REVIDRPHVAILATSNYDGRPQSSVIFVKRDGDTVVFSTIKGWLKTRNATRDPRVSLLVLDTKTGRYVGQWPAKRHPFMRCGRPDPTDWPEEAGDDVRAP